MTNTRTRLPLPNPVCIVTNMGAGRPQHFMLSTSHGVALMQEPAGSTLNLHSAKQMHAYSDAENAALRERVKVLEDALRGLDEAYCRAGTPLTKAERHEDRMRLIAARAVLAARKGEA